MAPEAKLHLYAAADIHGKRNRIDRLSRTVAECRPDVVVLAGDIAGWVTPDRTGGRLAALPVPVLVVFGNGDPPWCRRALSGLPGIIPMDLGEASVCGEHIVGVSGTVPLPFASRTRWIGEDKAMEKLASLVRPETILVAHPPPRGVVDTVFGKWHAGCGSLAEVVRTTSPALVLCGHIHESAGSTTIGRTVVVNCTMGSGGAGALINFEKGAVLSVELLGKAK
jgi:Icc-related predicted phosphoesterase